MAASPRHQASPPTLPIAVTALLLIYPVATMPLLHFELGGGSRSFILWETLKASTTGTLLFVTGFLCWCALGATAWKHISIAQGHFVKRGDSLRIGKGVRFALLWEAPVVMAMGVLVCALSLADLGSVRLSSGFYLLLGLGLITGLATPAQTKTAGAVSPNHKQSHARRVQTSITWALIVTSLIFYIPAMLWPVAEFTYKGNSESKTILGGVSALLEDGKWVLALIVFLASVAIPLLKLVVLCVLNFNYTHPPSNFTKTFKLLYGFVRITGRWALLDVFVVILLVSVIDFGLLAAVKPHPPGIYVFCAMVITTVFATASFSRQQLLNFQKENHE